MFFFFDNQDSGGINPADINFDKAIFGKNLNFLIKSSKITIGQLEELLGLSPGYISRTINPSSDKKLSIDAVWKIAKLAGVSIDDLTSRDISYSINSNLDIASKFILKLTDETHEDKITWNNIGGKTKSLSNELLSLGYFSKDNSTQTYTFCSDMKGEEKYIAGDVFKYNGAAYEKDLILMPYISNDETKTHYHFFFLCDGLAEGSKYSEELFDTGADYDGELDEQSQVLYRSVVLRESDLKLSQDTKSFLKAYISR